MSTTVPVTTDTLLSNVPKLDIKGTNWAIFSLRFEITVEVKELWDHFDGTNPEPVSTSTASPGGPTVVTPPDPDELAKWQKGEKLARHLLTQHIPDSTALRVHTLPSVAAMWAEIVREYTQKGAYVQTDLCAKFLESKCPAGGDIRQFLDDLHMKRDELSAVGVPIEEKDYRSTIIQSLPHHLASFASGQLATASLYSTTKTIEPNILISMIIEESERCNRKDARLPRSNTGARANGTDEAMMAADSSFCGRGGSHGNHQGSHCGGRGTGRQRPPCWNCGSREHFKARCPEPDKSTGATQGSAHAAADLDSEDNGIFAVDELLSDGESEGTLPDLLPPLSEDDEDRFSEIGDDATLSDDSDWVLGDIAAEVNEGHQQRGPVIELYDSGSTRHISPYHELFETLTNIPPKPFKAANQQSFNATGVGEMIIEVPNGADASQLRLTEVLFSPEVGYTLVSIGRLDELGYLATFTDGKCILHDPEEDIIGEIPKSN